MLATAPFVFKLWPWKTNSRAYHLGIDVTYYRCEDEITDPWLKSLTEEGPRWNDGLSLIVATDLVTSALEREDSRYTRELEAKNKPMDQGTVKHLAAIYGNLVATEEALRELVK